MNRNVLIVMAGGFLVAVLVAMVVQATLKTDKKKQPVKEEARVQIVVAAKPLKLGETLTADNVKWQDWPKSGVFEGLLLKQGDKKITDIASGKVKRAVAVGEPVTKSVLIDKKVNYLSATLKPGMRAVAITANAASAAGGFVAPGDYVDIVLTYRPRFTVPSNLADEESRAIVQKNLWRRASETIMQNVKVLAVDQAVVRNEEKVKAGKVYTMEVDPVGAQVLAMAGSVGSLELVLRGLGDDKVTDSKIPAASDARMTNLFNEIMRDIEGQRGGSGDESIVRLYNGNYVNQINVEP
ncbi:MAG: Flp pilus assembly protein CpaB [Micavibrio aeruginosavorus]|uniref:Flp pilus assembly protein CpaB n=1 Tax=Micavibrio aeruginosavorus TaxID=349221 RepID=A0A7T5R3S7_9BACT|nr:MAG: Flp pilus assembly protein CpaB [Micavibrio aeruginosavorus]